MKKYLKGILKDVLIFVSIKTSLDSTFSSKTFKREIKIVAAVAAVVSIVVAANALMGFASESKLSHTTLFVHRTSIRFQFGNWKSPIGNDRTVMSRRSSVEHKQSVKEPVRWRTNE